MSEVEKKYHLHSNKLEFLALKWAITEKFSDYLKYGPPFIVYTDTNPLTYVLTTAKLNATGLRWLPDLSDYNFTVKYRPGKANVDADYFSRRPLEIENFVQDCTEECNPQTVSSVVSAINVVSCVDISLCQLTPEVHKKLPVVDMAKLGEEQMSDSVIGPVYSAVLVGCLPRKRTWKILKKRSKIIMQNFKELIIVKGVLLKETQGGMQIVLPEKYHKLVYTELHENMAHLGAERVIDLARQRFYWPCMAKDIVQYIKKKCRCVVSKKPNVVERAPMVPTQAKYPFEMVSIDFLHLDKCKGGFEYTLVICDHFTRFTQAYATKNKSSKAAANKLFQEFILQFGFPKRIHHDRGPEFNSHLFKELHRLTGIRSSNTTPYPPMGDGQVERMNRTFCNMLKTLPGKEKNNWKIHLPKLAFAYNSTINKSSGYSPFYLMFGRHSILPIDSVFRMEEATSNQKKSISENL